VGGVGWSGAAGTPAGGPRTTRSTFCSYIQQKVERIASALVSSTY